MKQVTDTSKAILWFKNMDNYTFQHYALKYKHLIGEDRQVTSAIKEAIYLSEHPQPTDTGNTVSSEVGFTGGNWEKKFNVDNNCWDIKSGERLIASLPVCMDGEYGKYETSANIRLLLQAPALASALKGLLSNFDAICKIYAEEPVNWENYREAKELLNNIKVTK